MRRALIVAWLVSLGCDPVTLAPYGQVVVVVDTDLPAPSIAGRLRVDFYTADGMTWYDSRDLAVPDPSAWPLSFGVYSDDLQNDKVVLLRLRVYPDGRVQDYHGALGLAGGVTPATEPLPRLTVDRLVLLRVKRAVVSRAVVVLRGACVGAAATLSPPVTCTDTHGATSPVLEQPVDADVDGGVTSVVSTFGADTPCPTTPLPQGYECIPSGAFVFGGQRFANVNIESSAPDRVVLMSRFVIDRTEVTVGQYDDAVAHGLPPAPELATQLGFIPKNQAACVHSLQIAAAPMNCLSWESAALYCDFRGGKLPTEAQWERAATASQTGTYKRRFPWGDDPPSCKGTFFGRTYDDDPLTLYAPDGIDCVPPVDTTDGLVSGPPRSTGTSMQDVSAFGVLDMGGSLGEWTLDTGLWFGGPEWSAAPMRDPVVFIRGYTNHTVRGGSWRAASGGVDTLSRDFEAAFNDYIGFRCAYREPPGGWP